ncbi:Ger(x)C family spore germination protein [Paenibacillus sp. TAB 01]|uniref:Ger(x)C family spore germination protein n=1 Tax=Paenibacillus sp. TAB 01 TaxID=3368988 RepID=UPI003753D865
MVTVCLSLLMLFLLTGCWNSKDIQTMAYVTGLGLDYQNGKYITYVQVLNFSNIAKTEGMELGSTVPNWIGRGEGKTMTESFNAIYTSSQIRVFWGHLKAIVCTENLLKRADRIKEAYDMINRYREVRYNVLIYGTKVPLRDIFTQKSILNLSPLDTVMYSPTQIYAQRSFIPPIYGYKCVAHLNEPGSESIIPSISIVDNKWTVDYKDKPMLRINGAYFLSDQQLRGWLKESDLAGYRWLQKKMQRSALQIIDDNNQAVAALVLVRPKPEIIPIVQNGTPFFRISVNVKAFIEELTADITEKELEIRAAKAVKEEIWTTYKKGLATQADVFQLSQALYRNYPKVWNAERQEQAFFLNESSLKQIDVKVHLLHTGKYKGRIE